MAFNAQAALDAGYTQQEIDKYLRGKEKRSTGEVAKDTASGLFQALGITSNIAGGALEARRKRRDGGDKGTNKILSALSLFPGATGTIAGTAKAINIEPEDIRGSVEGLKSGVSSIGEAFAGQPISPSPTVMEELPRAVGLEPESPLGVAVGFAGEIATPDVLDVIKFGDLASRASQKFGKSMEKIGKKAARRGVKASPSQLTKFTQKTGKELEDVIVDKNLGGNIVENTLAALRKSQDEFDEIAINSGVKFDPGKLIMRVNAEIDGLGGAYNEAGELVLKGTRARQNSAVIKGLNELKEGLIEDISSSANPRQINIEDITALRRAIDDSITENNFAKMVQGTLSPDTAKRNVLQDFLREQTENMGIISSSGRSLKEIGTELSELISVDKILEKQKNLGKGSNILKLSTLLGGIGGAATGEDMPSGVKNALIGAGFASFANNPKVIGAISNVLLEGGRAIKNSDKLPKILEMIMRAGKEEFIFSGQQPTQDETTKSKQLKSEQL